jgi:hypothetical protein
MPFEPRPSQPPAAARPFPSVVVSGAGDVERTFIASVYRWMALGLGVTALVAWSVAGSQSLLQLIVFNKWIFYGLMIAEVGLVITLSAAVHRLPAAAAGALFLVYSALNGATLSIILLIYTSASIGSAFAVTAATFLGMSVYGTVTKKDLTSWASFLMMGLFGVVIAGVVNIFIGSSAIEFMVAGAAVIVFTGLTAYDTQKLRAYARAGGAEVAAAPVAGALSLYLDFINLFLSILRLFGKRR